MEKNMKKQSSNQNCTEQENTSIVKKIKSFVKKILKKLLPRKVRKGLRYLQQYGLRATIRKVLRLRFITFTDSYHKSDFEAQMQVKFDRDIKFSILVPLYNTPLLFLQEMIDSVVKQTYPNWELCLADGSDDAHAEVGEKCRTLAENEPRIKYLKLEKNLGISENTNACIDMSTGDYIVLFDHDDILHRAALYEFMQVICRDNADFIYTDELTFVSPNIKKIASIHYKPDFAPDNLRANNYSCHLSTFSRELLEKAGKFRREFDGSQDHDMILRLTEQANKIVHIPKVLYFWRSHPQSVAQNIDAKDYAIKAAHNAILASLERRGIHGATVESLPVCKSAYRIHYPILTEEKVSIIIPTKNHASDLKKCIASILEKTTYPSYEIVIVDNGSDEQELLDYYEELKKMNNVTVCSLDIPFNYSKINNYAIEQATGSYYLLLNNDIEIITPNWIEEMMMFVQREDVGAAGAMLYYPDDTVQHAGVILGMGGIAGHMFRTFGRNDPGYMCRMGYAQDVTAVTAACMLIKASVYHEVGGLDESFEVAFNDIDLCMKIRKAGYLIVWTPFAEAYHYESKSRGNDDTPEKKARFMSEIKRFEERWGEELKAGDPYYNPNLSLYHHDFRPKV